MSSSRHPDPPVSAYPPAIFLVCCLLAGAVLALVAAVAWDLLADPPAAQLGRSGVFFGEQQLDQQVGVTLWFLVVGAALGLVSGAVIARVGRAHGVVAVAGVMITCLAASVLSARLGIQVLGPDEQAQLAGAPLGTTITAELSVTTKVAYLGWPLGGLSGALLAIWRWPVSETRFTTEQPSPTFALH